jgi:hypothetical protein
MHLEPSALGHVHDMSVRQQSLLCGAQEKANFKFPENGNMLEEVSSLKGLQRLYAIYVTG